MVGNRIASGTAIQMLIRGAIQSGTRGEPALRHISGHDAGREHIAVQAGWNRVRGVHGRSLQYERPAHDVSAQAKIHALAEAQ